MHPDHVCSETLADFARSDSRPGVALTRHAAAASVTIDVKRAAPLRFNQVTEHDGNAKSCKTCVHTQHARLLPRRKAVHAASIACRASSQHKYKGTSDSRCTTSSTGNDCQHPTEGIVNYTVVLDNVLRLTCLKCCVICAATILTRRQTLQALAAAAVAVALPVDVVSAAEAAGNPTADVQVVLPLPSLESAVHAC